MGRIIDSYEKFMESRRINETLFGKLVDKVKNMSDSKVGSEIRNILKDLKVPMDDNKVSLFQVRYEGGNPKDAKRRKFQLWTVLENDDKVIPNVLIAKNSDNELVVDDNVSTVMEHPIVLITFEFDFTKEDKIALKMDKKYWNFETNEYQGKEDEDAETTEYSKEEFLEVIQEIDKLGTETMFNPEKIPTTTVGELKKNDKVKAFFDNEYKKLKDEYLQSDKKEAQRQSKLEEIKRNDEEFKKKSLKFKFYMVSNKRPELYSEVEATISIDVDKLNEENYNTNRDKKIAAHNSFPIKFVGTYKNTQNQEFNDDVKDAVANYGKGAFLQVKPDAVYIIPAYNIHLHDGITKVCEQEAANMLSDIKNTFNKIELGGSEKNSDIYPKVDQIKLKQIAFNDIDPKVKETCQKINAKYYI